MTKGCIDVTTVYLRPVPKDELGTPSEIKLWELVSHGAMTGHDHILLCSLTVQASSFKASLAADSCGLRSPGLDL